MDKTFMISKKEAFIIKIIKNFYLNIKKSVELIIFY